MHNVLNLIFPIVADNHYQGSQIASIAFLLLAIIGIVRSCIHFFAPDGGAGTIAGMDLSVPGADGIKFAFALWGSAQLLYALIQLVIFFRYKTLIPLMYLLMFLEIVLRMMAGRMKPVRFSHTPPGQVGNYILLPLSAILFYLSL
ncbi:hypothetical protein O9H85_33650 [Paenibacillus filicis]|uniref:Yip1 domain-containing protein n=1 Tax=Paenibacillus gyeongsangnamensis TaxID=3388067 RepID=A0ABT4QK13_9BACL|nr:hypothetical protein [Paenibacillus filicis]MCZ8517209.1 hypothetical protein [Paenibacillus filicis]